MKSDILCCALAALLMLNCSSSNLNNNDLASYVDPYIGTDYHGHVFLGADGLCGNEDCGQMSAWYILSALGFYPVNPANGVYVFGSQAVKEAEINLFNGKTFKVIAKNNSPENIYIQSVKLNGKDYQKAFILHQDIMDGGAI